MAAFLLFFTHAHICQYLRPFANPVTGFLHEIGKPSKSDILLIVRISRGKIGVIKRPNISQ
jgi:hypothetical protein